MKEEIGEQKERMNLGRKREKGDREREVDLNRQKTYTKNS